jgi:SEC-C motif-containing protein
MSARYGANEVCGCGSGLKYKRCCQPAHLGRPASEPVALMRSRYCAYRFGLVDYLIDTTDPRGPAVRGDRSAWRAEIGEFVRTTALLGLTVEASGCGEEDGWVRFAVRIRQGDGEATYAEESQFRRIDGRWLYHSGALTERRGDGSVGTGDVPERVGQDPLGQRRQGEGATGPARGGRERPG